MPPMTLNALYLRRNKFEPASRTKIDYESTFLAVYYEQLYWMQSSVARIIAQLGKCIGAAA
jgi:hypothetical protein